jgi:hypothetical protein
MGPLTFRSEGIPWASGAQKNLPLDFIPDKGPHGGRLVIESVQIRSTLNLTSTTTALIKGENMSSFVKRLKIRDADGDLVNVTGAALRAHQIAELGEHGPADPANTTASTTADATFVHVLPFCPPRARRRWDTAVPVSHLKSAGGAGQGGAVEIEMPASSDLDAPSGDTVTINSGTYEFYFHCREEHDNEVHTRMELKEITSAANNDHYLPVNGGWLRYALMYLTPADSDGGFPDISACTAVHIDQLKAANIRPDVLINQFVKESSFAQRYHGQYAAATLAVTNPFTSGSAFGVVPLVFPRFDGKISELYRILGSLYVRTEGLSANPKFLMQVVTPRTRRSTQAERARAGSVSSITIKTAGKSKRNPKAWGSLAQALPAKFQG